MKHLTIASMVFMCDKPVAAYGVRFSPDVGVFRVNEMITCSARGYPTPLAHWQRVRDDGGPAPWSTGPVLSITVGMVGDNTWRCRATNIGGSDERIISFLVVGMCLVDDGWVNKTSAKCLFGTIKARINLLYESN